MPQIAITSDEARQAFAEMRAGLPGVAVLSFIIALFPVFLALYLLLVFSVALPGHSLSTLIGLTLIMLFITGFHGYFCFLRRRMLGQIGNIVARNFMPRLDEATALLGEAHPRGLSDGMQVSRDLDTLQTFIKSGAATAWLDIGALPIILIMLLILHVWLALTVCIVGAALLFILMRTVRQADDPAQNMVSLLERRHAISETGRSHLNVIRALGMRGQAMRAWTYANNNLLRLDTMVRTRQALNLVIARGLQYLLFAAVLTVGGWLAIDDRASVSVVISSAMLSWFAVTPIIEAIENASLFVQARQGWDRLDTILHSVKSDPPTIALPAPAKLLNCEGMAIAAPGMKRPMVYGVTFALNAGDVVAVVGPAGCGKSAVLRGIAGAWPVLGGKVRLDGAALDQWANESLGKHIGYLPQTIDLLDGTVAQNIARFDPDADPRAIVGAAQSANVHDIIVGLPEGYNTLVGAGGRMLSVSQSQRIGLARALFGDPFLIVLDEPTSQIDTAGDQQFAEVILNARNRGAVIVLAGVAPCLVDVATHVLMLRNGTMAQFGEKNAVRERILTARSAQAISTTPAAPDAQPRTESAT